MRIARDLLDQVIDHARRDAPDECCGLISVRDGAAVDVHPLENIAHSPLRFDTGIDLHDALEQIEDAGAEVGAIYHSHTRSAPYPSQTDINWAHPWWEEVEWLIVGLAGDEPEVRSYRIKGGTVREVEVEVT